MDQSIPNKPPSGWSQILLYSYQCSLYYDSMESHAADTQSLPTVDQWQSAANSAGIMPRLLVAMQERVMKHPCNSWWLRTAAAVEASLIKTWSECGRLWGLWRRQELLKGTVCRRFDWFGGLSAQIVAAERQRALWRFMVCGGAAFGVAVAAACAMCPGPVIDTAGTQ